MSTSTCTTTSTCPDHLPIYKGATFHYIGKITDENGDAVDLTGFTFQGCIRLDPDSDPIFFDFELLDQITNEGEFAVIMPWEISQDIPTKAYKAPNRPVTYYLGDFEIIQPDGEIFPLYKFVADVIPLVTPDEV